jgi:hypothetical protein
MDGYGLGTRIDFEQLHEDFRHVSHGSKDFRSNERLQNQAQVLRADRPPRRITTGGLKPGYWPVESQPQPPNSATKLGNSTGNTSAASNRF